MEYLYHYTHISRWIKIQESGYLKLTQSNLLEPVNPHWVTQEDGTRIFADETDSYKPVVWLTNDENPAQQGLSAPKQTIQIAIPYDKQKHLWWVEWKDKHRMKTSWFKKLTSHGERYATWYISEEAIPVSDIAWVRNRATGEILYQKEGVQVPAYTPVQQSKDKGAELPKFPLQTMTPAVKHTSEILKQRSEKQQDREAKKQDSASQDVTQFLDKVSVINGVATSFEIKIVDSTGRTWEQTWTPSCNDDEELTVDDVKTVIRFISTDTWDSAASSAAVHCKNKLLEQVGDTIAESFDNDAEHWMDIMASILTLANEKKLSPKSNMLMHRCTDITNRPRTPENVSAMVKLVKKVVINEKMFRIKILN